MNTERNMKINRREKIGFDATKVYIAKKKISTMKTSEEKLEILEHLVFFFFLNRSCDLMNAYFFIDLITAVHRMFLRHPFN